MLAYVTGASGFAGGHVVDALAASGVEVRTEPGSAVVLAAFAFIDQVKGANIGVAVHAAAW